jgi:hypothetical protein
MVKHLFDKNQQLTYNKIPQYCTDLLILILSYLVGLYYYH